jgi:hypothetical protein
MKKYISVYFVLVSCSALIKACPFDTDAPHSPCATNSHCSLEGLSSANCLAEIKRFCCDGLEVDEPKGCHKFKEEGGLCQFTSYETRKRKIAGSNSSSGGEGTPPTPTSTTTPTTTTPSTPTFCDIEDVYIVDLTESKKKLKKWKDAEIVSNISSEVATTTSTAGSNDITVTISPDHDYTIITSLNWQQGDPLAAKIKKSTRGYAKNASKSIVKYNVSGYDLMTSTSPYAISGMKKKHQFLPLEIQTCRSFSIVVSSFTGADKGKEGKENGQVDIGSSSSCDDFKFNLILKEENQDC